MKSTLTSEEQKIIDLLRANPLISNKEIADKLEKSVKTIETQLTQIYKRQAIAGSSWQRRVALTLKIERNEI